jgi:hypothetical protein
VTHQWRHVGAVTVVKGGTVYGPLIAGPEGVTKLVIFRDHRSKVIAAKEAQEIRRDLRESSALSDLNTDA